MIRCWRADSPTQTVVLASVDDRLPAVIHWGAPLPGDEDLETLSEVAHVAPTGGMLDAAEDVSVWSGGAGFRFVDQPDSQTLRFAEAETELQLKIWPFPSGLIGLAFKVATGEIADLPAPEIALPAAVRDARLFFGRWTREFQTEERAIGRGTILVENRTGRTSHEYFPGVYLLDAAADESHGEVRAAHLETSAGHEMKIETLPDGRRMLRMREAGRPVSTPDTGLRGLGPTLLLGYDGAGTNGVSQCFHRHLRGYRERMWRRPLHVEDRDDSDDWVGLKWPRPVHYNCWEAVYFDHDPDVLCDLARRAARLGVERFVLDDGWFGRRDDDTSSLGDWTMDRRKWPDGFAPLIDTVKASGMDFGLWVEPEMVNEDSDLYRAHPDWILGPPDQLRGRGQLVLDMTREAVRDYLFDRLHAVLSEHDIAYLKWDHNRVLPFSDARQKDGTRALMRRLLSAHPGLEIETCASGGGRVDFSILKECCRFWPSDSNDAIERVRIQRGASHFFPPEITGSHVGPRVCHTSGRILPMAFRAAVAGTRAMGIEMDLRELTPEEERELAYAIGRFKSRRAVLHDGAMFRLDGRDPAVIAEMHVGAQGFLLFAAQIDSSAQSFAHPVRLCGLDPTARYRLTLENAAAVEEVLNRGPKSPFVAGRQIEMSGAALMHVGLQLPNAFPATLWEVSAQRLAG